MKHSFYKYKQFYRNILTYEIHKKTYIRHFIGQVEQQKVNFLSSQINILNLHTYLRYIYIYIQRDSKKWTQFRKSIFQN